MVVVAAALIKSCKLSLNLIHTLLAHPLALTLVLACIYTIGSSVDCELPEDHLVLSKCARFIRENKLDLPELLN